jgi:hypothetical protein
MAAPEESPHGKTRQETIAWLGSYVTGAAPHRLAWYRDKNDKAPPNNTYGKAIYATGPSGRIICETNGETFSFGLRRGPRGRS